MAQPLIQLNGIARDFFDGRQLRRVLKKMDLSIYPGELTILAGRLAMSPVQGEPDPTRDLADALCRVYPALARLTAESTQSEI